MKTTRFDNQKAWRVIGTRNPSVDLFEAAASVEDFEDLFTLEAAFSPHYGDLRLRLSGLPQTEWVFGPGASFVMAPFVYRTPSRFSDASYGVFYAGLAVDTAIQEVAFHRARFMASTSQGPAVMEQLIVSAQVTGTMGDLRGLNLRSPILDPNSYAASQAEGAKARMTGLEGLAYPSVRHLGGECVAIFRPKAVSKCAQVRPLRYLWDGKAISGWV